MKTSASQTGAFERRTPRRRARLRLAIRAMAVAAAWGTGAARAEMILVLASEMAGIERWREGQSWGAGNEDADARRA